MKEWKYIVSGLIGGSLEVPFYIDDLSIFSKISLRILGIPSPVLGIVLHLIASVVIALISLWILDALKIKGRGYLDSLIIGIMLGSSVLALFSLPVHLTVFPIIFNLVYIASHVFYGVFVYLTYYLLERKYQ